MSCAALQSQNEGNNDHTDTPSCKSSQVNHFHALTHKITITELVTVGITTVTMALSIMNIVIHEWPLSQALAMLSLTISQKG